MRPGPVYDAMHKAPAAALDWLALTGRTAHWLKWSGGGVGERGCRVANARGLGCLLCVCARIATLWVAGLGASGMGLLE